MFKKKIKDFVRPFYLYFFGYKNGLFSNYFSKLWDVRLTKKISVKENNIEIFKIYDYGKITRMRASTFTTKEPETLDWIKTFNKEDKLIDIGSNIGIYALYAAKKGIEVVAIEPDALNHALLSLNILLNNLGKKITPYSIAIHEEEKFSKLFLQSALWGGALNSFDNTLDQFGSKYLPIHSQGVFGLPLDLLIEKIGFIN